MRSDGLKPPTVLPSAAVSTLLALVWLQPWAPGPLSNTVPLLLSWAVPAVLLALGQLPTALECARAWAWAAVLSSLMGLLQFFGEAAHLGGWVHVPAYLGDAVGNLRQRNQLATHLAIGMAAVLWWHRQGLRSGHALWMLALMACAMAATGSRTGLLQLLMLPPLLWLWLCTRPRSRTDGHALAPDWRLALWAVAMYLLASAVLPAMLNWHTGQSVDTALARMGEASGCGSRRVLWANVLHLIGQEPWTGWGWGELKYAHYMAPYSGERFCDILGNAHNLPLQLAVELGVPLALAACLALLALLWRAQPWRLRRSNDALAWGVLAPIALHSLLEYPLWYGPFQLATLAALVLLWPGAARTVARHRRTLQVLATVGMCLLALMAWDYQRVRQIYLPPAQRSALWQSDPWGAARQTWFFGGALRFAEVTVTPLTPDNARALLDASLRTLHDSPEPRVVDKLIDSARLLGQHPLADWHQAQKQKVYGQTAP
jgi:O-antigen ligase